MTQERMRFNINDDLVLMREVIAINPYENVDLWKDVHNKLVAATGKMFSLRAIKDHLDHLLKLWREADTTNLRKSGSEEQYEEKEQPLQSISDLAKEFKSKKDSGGRGECDARKKGLEARDAAQSNISVIEWEVSNESVTDAMLPDDICNTLTFNESNDPGPSTRYVSCDQLTTQACQRKTDSPVISTDHQQDQPIQAKKRRFRESALKNSSLQFLHDKRVADNALRKIQLELEERKLDMEQNKMELEERKVRLEESKWKMEESDRQKWIKIEIAEREQRLAVEIEERRQRLKQAEQQQQFMELMFQLITKK